MYRNKILGSKQLEVFKYLKSKFMGDAVIAGGAVRDMFFKKPFKDIDIWFHSQKIGVPQRFFEIYLPRDLQFDPKEDYIDISDRFPGEQITEPPPAPRAVDDDAFTALIDTATPFTRAQVRIEGRPWERLRVPEPISSGEHLMDPSRSKRVNYSFNLFYKGDHYQLMNVSSHPMNFIRDEFDIGLCKIAHDGERIIRTKAFDQDLRNKTLSIDGKKLGPKNFEWALEKHIPRIQKLYPDFKVNILSKPTKDEKRAEKLKMEIDFGRAAAAARIRMGEWATANTGFTIATSNPFETAPTTAPAPLDLSDPFELERLRQSGTRILRWQRTDLNANEFISLADNTTPTESGLVGTWVMLGPVA
jgi:hypothetical protein